MPRIYRQNCGYRFLGTLRKAIKEMNKFALRHVDPDALRLRKVCVDAGTFGELGDDDS